MKVSEAITVSQKASIIKAASEKLCLLARHPSVKELIEEIRLSPIIKEENCVRRGLFGTPKKWSGTEKMLKFTSRGIVEEITSRENYKYTTGGTDLVACVSQYKSGGTEKTSERLIQESWFPNLPEKYDLDPDALQKVINLLNQ